MSSKIIGIVIAAAILVGGGVYLATQSGDDETNGTSTSENTNTETDNDSGADPTVFNAKSNADEPFTATITGTNEGESFNGKIEFDGQGSGKFTSTSEDGNMEFFFTPEGFISCQGDECYKLPSGGAEPFSLQDYTFAEEDFNDFRNTATYQGRQDCPAGTCDVWQVTDEGIETTIFLNTDDQRISQVIGVENGETTTIVYEFGPVTITIPENVQELPAL